MQRLFFTIITGLLIFIGSIKTNAQNLSVESLVQEARIANALSDRFKSYRILSFLKEKRLSSFVKSALPEHIESISPIMTNKQLVNECEKWSKVKDEKARNEVLLACSLRLTDRFQLDAVKSLLSKVADLKNLPISLKIVQASIDLGEGNGVSCLKQLQIKDASKIVNQNTKDLYYITRARCLVETNKWSDAVVEYQKISPTSTYYYNALEETAWAQFKNRNLESSRTLLDVIVTTYETNLNKAGRVDAVAYFRSRYLQAYIELVERNNKKAEQLFRSLFETISKYVQQIKYNEATAKKVANLIAVENIKWLDTKAMPKEVTDFLNLVEQWADVKQRKRIEQRIELQFSLSREIMRLKSAPLAEFDGYLKNIMDLEMKNVSDLSSEMVKASRSIERNIRVMNIKSELGRIEIVWSERSDGVRGISEVLEAYQGEINEVEDFF